MTDNNAMYNRWCQRATEDAQLVSELQSIAGQEKEIDDRFYQSLSFGTAGLRGVLGAGTNRMNLYTVRQATQGLAAYINEAQPAGAGAPSVAIAYDSRINSELFAKEAACVLAANGVKAWLYGELMPTPALSFAVRELGCQSGIIITASHNPAKYNGYKAYDATGCQIEPEVAAAVSRQITAADIFDDVKHIPFEEGLKSGSIAFIPEEITQLFLHRILEEQITPGICQDAGLRVVYTPLNGAGRRCVLSVLRDIGIQDVFVVPEQEWPDGHFPTCPYPNPEIRETVELGLQLCKAKEADLLLATDPDCDRVAVAVREGDDYRIITGNEMGVLLLDYIASGRQRAGRMPSHPVAVMSIVSTSMAERVADFYGVELRRVLTGFKFIGEQIRLLEEAGESDRYIFGFEESCGYLSGGYVRDKDGVNASMLICEMAAYYRQNGSSLSARLEALYHQFGCYRNNVQSFMFEGADGMAKMAGIMKQLRNLPPAQIAGHRVEAIADYLTSQKQEGDKVMPLTLPQSDVLEYSLFGAGKVIIRPSGTEPKLKAYYMLVGATFADTDALYEHISADVQALLGV